jgi:outer membrane protein OmpA-like peptidoglycan-associated protein
MEKILSVILFIAASGISWSANSDTQQTQGVVQQNPSKDEFIKSLDPKNHKPKPRSRGIALVPSIPLKKPKPPEPENKENASEPGTAIPAEVSVPDIPQISVNMTFEFNSSQLTDATRITLDNLGQAMQDQKLKPYNFIIEGHTDSIGDASYNWELSLRRAAAVKRYLIEAHQVSPKRLKIIGKGEAEPIYPENPKAPQNRRVIIINSG